MREELFTHTPLGYLLLAIVLLFIIGQIRLARHTHRYALVCYAIALSTAVLGLILGPGVDRLLGLALTFLGIALGAVGLAADVTIEQDSRQLLSILGPWSLLTGSVPPNTTLPSPPGRFYLRKPAATEATGFCGIGALMAVIGAGYPALLFLAAGVTIFTILIVIPHAHHVAIQ